MVYNDSIDYLKNNTLAKHHSMEQDLRDSSSNQTCILTSIYFDFEAYCYLFVMFPLAIIGIVLNIVNLKIFSNKSFNSVTFKYIRLITITDLFICITIIPYFLTAYTQPFNKYDMFARHLYLSLVYIPGANLAINLNTFLNLLVTIERLISVGWPTQRYTLFKPSRYYISCFIVISLAVVLNTVNFFLYKAELCNNHISPRQFVYAWWWGYYGYAKEILTRVLPIILLIVANIALVIIVRNSRNKMKKSVNFQPKIIESKTPSNRKEQSKCACFAKENKKTRTKSANEVIKSIDSNSALLKTQKSNRNRQENQLTWMTIAVAILFLVTSIPMVFAYPGLVFSLEQVNKAPYKMYAVLVNTLELLQCILRIVIYYSFTTQFREVFNKMFGLNVKKKEIDTEPSLTMPLTTRNQVNTNS